MQGITSYPPALIAFRCHMFGSVSIISADPGKKLLVIDWKYFIVPIFIAIVHNTAIFIAILLGLAIFIAIIAINCNYLLPIIRTNQLYVSIIYVQKKPYLPKISVI